MGKYLANEFLSSRQELKQLMILVSEQRLQIVKLGKENIKLLEDRKNSFFTSSALIERFIERTKSIFSTVKFSDSKNSILSRKFTPLFKS